MQHREWRSLGLEEKKKLALAGTLIYQPSFKLCPDLVQRFQHLLARECCFRDAGRYPKIEADWNLVRGIEDGTYHSSRIVLFYDGTDEPARNEHWENCGVLFYRQDSELNADARRDEVTHRIHVPEQAGQDELLSCYEILDELRSGRSEQLDDMHQYLLTVLDDPAVWSTLQDLDELA